MTKWFQLYLQTTVEWLLTNLESKWRGILSKMKYEFGEQMGSNLVNWLRNHHKISDSMASKMWVNWLRNHHKLSDRMASKILVNWRQNYQKHSDKMASNYFVKLLRIWLVRWQNWQKTVWKRSHKIVKIGS